MIEISYKLRLPGRLL